MALGDKGTGVALGDRGGCLGQGDRGGSWTQGWQFGTAVGAVSWPSSASHRTQDSPWPQRGSGWAWHRPPGCSVGAGPSAGPPSLGRSPEAPLQPPQEPGVPPQGPEMPPQGPAAASSCPGNVAKGLLSPGSRGQVLEVRTGRAAGAGITAGRKCCSVSPASVLIPFNSPDSSRGHQPSPGSRGSSQPPSSELFWRKASKKEPKNVGKRTS